MTTPRLTDSYFDSQEESRLLSEGRSLAQNETLDTIGILNKYRDDFIELRVIQNSLDDDGSVDNELSFEWGIDSFDGQTMQILIDFEEPLQVSSSQQKDLVRVRLLESDFFVSKQGIPFNGSDSEIESEIPPQISDELAEVMQTAATVLTASSVSISAGNFAVNILIAGSLNSLWQMIESQQLVVLIPMFAVIIPANTAIVFNVLMQVAAFDPIPAESTTAKWLNLEETGPFKSDFEIMGFASYFCLYNLGSQTIVLCLVLLGLFVTQTVVSCCFCCDCCHGQRQKRVQQFQKKCRKPFKYNFFLRMMRELYLIILICALINLYYFKVDTYGRLVNSVVAVILICFTTAYPLLIYCVLMRSNTNWWKGKFNDKFGSLYSHLRKKGPTRQTLSRYVLFFYLRRLLLVVVIMWFQSFLVAQFFFYINLLIVSLILLNYIRPFATARANMIEIVNEILVMFIMYHMFTFTDFVGDPALRSKIGFSAILMVSIHILFNLTVIASESLKHGIQRCKIKYRLRAIKAQRKRGESPHIDGKAMAARLFSRKDRESADKAKSMTNMLSCADDQVHRSKRDESVSKKEHKKKDGKKPKSEKKDNKSRREVRLDSEQIQQAQDIEEIVQSPDELLMQQIVEEVEKQLPGSLPCSDSESEASPEAGADTTKLDQPTQIGAGLKTLQQPFETQLQHQERTQALKLNKVLAAQDLSKSQPDQSILGIERLIAPNRPTSFNRGNAPMTTKQAQRFSIKETYKQIADEIRQEETNLEVTQKPLTRLEKLQQLYEQTNQQNLRGK